MPLLPERSPADKEASAAWLLAREAARVLRDPADRDRRERILENAHRLLQAYGTSTGPVRAAGLRERTLEALEAAFEASFPGTARQEAIQALTDRLRAVAYPDGAAIPDAAAAAFFELVEGRLDRTAH